LIRRPSKSRRNLIPYAALLLVLLVGAGGGYALAASKAKTITVCADKKTGILHLHNRGKCKRTQRRVTWNARGPQGAQGAQGPAGQPGAPAVSVWGQVATNGALAFGQGLSVQHLSQPGTYQVTITAPACAHGLNAPLVSVSDGPPSGGAFPVSWFQSTGGNQQFEVFTGLVSGGAVTLADHTFTVMDSCM
jgi:hypothetical protein